LIISESAGDIITAIAKATTVATVKVVNDCIFIFLFAAC
jgi:hypothetical protein